MQTLDKDLASIQEVRHLVNQAQSAQKKLSSLDQNSLNQVVKILSEAAFEASESLAKLANEETGFGKWEDKKQKNILASEKLFEKIKEMKTVGVIGEDKNKGIVEVGVPMGVVAALIPSTNPSSTVIYKTLISIKAGNAIVFSPHPSALNTIMATVNVLKKACQLAGVSEDLVSCISMPTLQATDALMKHKNVSMILATGGSAMVKAAYSSGTPALGVGPGNVPVYIEKTADIKDAVEKIFRSKNFDYGTVCASEQAIVVDACIESRVRNEVINRGGHFLRGEDLKKVKAIMERPNGSMNPEIVGKSAQTIARMANIDIPHGTKILLSDEPGVGPKHPFSKEKLTQLLGYYVVKNWQEACVLCHELLVNGGLGHSFAMHSKDDEIIRKLGLALPVSRFLVNTPSTHGAVGLSTNLFPSFTLGCGTIGGSATSDNVTPLHLINIKRIAYGVERSSEEKITEKNELSMSSMSNIDIEKICEMVMNQIKLNS